MIYGIFQKLRIFGNSWTVAEGAKSNCDRALRTSWASGGGGRRKADKRQSIKLIRVSEAIRLLAVERICGSIDQWRLEGVWLRL